MKFIIPIILIILIAGVGGYMFFTRDSGIHGEPLSLTDLKYRVIEKFGPVGDAPGIFYCDPDYYPIAFRDEAEIAAERFPELQANKEEFTTIVRHLNIGGIVEFSPEQKLVIYREHKKLNAFTFELVEDKYKFELTVTDEKGLGLGEGTRIEGTINQYGDIRITKEKTGFITTCPICLAGATMIDTPKGGVAVRDLQEGMEVWTQNAKGDRVRAVILKTGKTKVPSTHRVVRLTLQDARELVVSPGHPLADGRRVGEIKAGDIIENSKVLRVEFLAYGEFYTYDILPSGETGTYWANGILLESTLEQKIITQ